MEIYQATIEDLEGVSNLFNLYRDVLSTNIRFRRC